MAELKQRIASLPAAKQVDLAAFLDDLFNRAAAGSLSAEWRQELRRRTDEIDGGRVSLLPWEEVRDELERDFG